MGRRVSKPSNAIRKLVMVNPWHGPLVCSSCYPSVPTLHSPPLVTSFPWEELPVANLETYLRRTSFHSRRSKERGLGAEFLVTVLSPEGTFPWQLRQEVGRRSLVLSLPQGWLPLALRCLQGFCLSLLFSSLVLMCPGADSLG